MLPDALTGNQTARNERPYRQTSVSDWHSCWVFLHPQIIHNLRVMAWNANSVTNKKAELDMFLRINKIDIAAVSETKLSPNRRFSIPGYTTVRMDRNQFGGGTMLLINNKPLSTKPQVAPVRFSISSARIYLHSYRPRRHLYSAWHRHSHRWLEQ